MLLSPQPVEGSPFDQRQQTVERQFNIAGDVNLYTGIVYTGSAYARRDYPAETADLFDFYGRLFAGREETLRQITELASRDTGGHTLVESPPAFGKSALLAQAILHLKGGGAADGVEPRAIFFLRPAGR